MGEYYNWVNINKKEYIAPCDFGLGSKIYGAVVADNQLLGALYDLLSSDWKGDMIVFLGAETNITENDAFGTKEMERTRANRLKDSEN